MTRPLFRIGIGGIAIECCTFSPLPTRYADFQVHRGAELVALHPTLAQAEGVTLASALFAHATPGGPVARDAYEALKSEFLEGIRRNLPLDGLYLNMHGAMFVEGMEDAEADWTGAARAAVGPDCLISASYDLHGNLSPAVVDALDLVTAYRTAPHEDMAETRERAIALLLACLRTARRPHKALAIVPVLLPGERVMTTREPAKSLYARIPEVIADYHLLDASILVGYAWADEPRVAASVIALGEDPEAARAAADALAGGFWAQRAEFTLGAPAADVDACIRMALAHDQCAFFISDSGDNITAGAVGDSPHVLGRLLALQAPDAVVAPLIDAAATAACFEAGAGAEVALEVGAGLDPSQGPPVPLRGRVLRLEDRGVEGRQAVLRAGGVDVILCERRVAFTELGQFHALDIEPATRRIIVVKLGYLFPELMRIATGACLAFSPGVVPLNVEALPYRRVRRPIYPLDAN
jgi:microcystin degradation protein MlrC